MDEVNALFEMNGAFYQVREKITFSKTAIMCLSKGIGKKNRYSFGTIIEYLLPTIIAVVLLIQWKYYQYNDYNIDF